MLKKLVKRFLNVALTIGIVLSCLIIPARAEITIETGYNDTTQILSLHNSETNRHIDQIKGYVNSTQNIGQVLLGTTTHSETVTKPNATYEHLTTYVYRHKKYPWNSYSVFKTFTVKIYDKLTIKTIKDGAETQEVYTIYRDESQSFIVNEIPNYTVQVSGVVEGGAGNYTVSGLTGDATVIIAYIADTQSHITVGDTSATVDCPAVVDADTEVTITAVPATNTYISGIVVKKGTEEVNVDLTSFEYLADGQGTAVAKFVTESSKNEYTVTVLTEPILTWKPELSINFNDKMNHTQAQAAIEGLVNRPDDVNLFYIEFHAGGILTTWTTLDYPGGTIGHAFGEQSTERVRVTYNYNENLPQYKTTTIEAVISLNDTRVNPTIVLNSNVEIGYTGSAINESQVLNALFSSLIYGETVILDEVNSDIYLDKFSVLGVDLVWAYKQNENGDYNISVNGAIGDGITSTLVGDVTGNYKVTVVFEGDAQYKSTSLDGYFTIYDNRLQTTTNVQDKTVEHNDLSTINYNLQQVKDLLLVDVVDENGDTLSNDNVIITSINRGLNVSYSTLLNINNMPLTDAGEYTVNFEYQDTLTHKKSTATATLTIVDARPTIQIVLNENVTIPYAESTPVVEENVFDLAFNSASYGGNDLPVSYADELVQLYDGDGNEINAADIKQAGTYTVKVTIPSTDSYHGNSAEVEFTVSDGRNITKVEMNEVDEVSYDFYDGLSEEELLAIFDISVIDTVTNETISADEYTIEFKKNDIAVTPAEITVGNGYAVVVTFAGNGDQAPCKKTHLFNVVDNRETAVITLNEGVSIIYRNEGYTDQEIYDLVFASLKDEFDNDIVAIFEGENANMTIVVPSNLNARTHSVTVKFAGDAEHKPTETTVEIVVEKADTAVNVNSSTFNYQDIKETGVNVSELITSDPEAKLIEFAIGFGLGEDVSSDTSIMAYVNIPELVNVDEISPAWLRNLVVSVLSVIENGAELTIDQLREALTSVLSGLEALEGTFNIDIDTTTIERLISVLQQIENLDGVGSLKVKLTMGKDIVVCDAGAYLVGGIVSDANYNEGINFGYVLIVPELVQVDLAFNIVDENHIITRKAILSGDYDLGSHVIRGNLSDEMYQRASEALKNIYIGVNINGETYISNDPSAEIGAYTQIAYVLKVGNELYYALPIVRAYVVVADIVTVEFIDELGNVNHDRQFVYNQNPHTMTARATDRNGNVLDPNNITYRYVGVQTDLTPYNSTEGPIHAGAYTVIATYLDETIENVGMAIGAMVILPAEATVTVTDKLHIYDNTRVDVTEMVTKSPEDAKITLITAGIDVSGDFSENSWQAVNGVVNFDLPARADQLMQQYFADAYANGITIEQLTARINEFKAMLNQAGLSNEYVDKLLDVVAQISENTTITFKEQAEVNPVSIGAYLIGAVVTDPDYYVAYDTGILLISPELTEAVLKWDYEDANNIFTRPLLDLVGLTASCYVEDVKDDALTDRVEYLFIGFDFEGNSVVSTDPYNLPNGTYTQIAYIKDEISANMAVAIPLTRVVIIVPQPVEMDLVDSEGVAKDVFTYVYDGQAKELSAIVNKLDGSAVDEGSLTINYVGVNTTEYVYNSTTPPTNAGVYEVVATYAEKDANGNVKYLGTTLATLVIEQKEAIFELFDTTAYDDGDEKFVDVNNPVNLPMISIIIDEANDANIILPEIFEVGNGSYNVAEAIASLKAALANIEVTEENEAIINKINEILDVVDINMLNINGPKPTAVGTYKVISVGFARNYKPVVDSAILTIVHEYQQKYDDTHHWDECIHCGDKKDIHPHEGEWIVTSEPTCTLSGLETYECNVCDYVTTREIPALGHDLVHHEAKAPTCTEVGWNAYDECARCGYTTYQEIPALGHTEGETVIENVVAPTCETDGSHDEVVYCTVCGAELSRVTVTDPKTGHDWDDGTVTTAPTCTETGIKTYTCQNDPSHTYTETIPALGHTEGETVIENVVAPTCETDGSHDEVVYCTVCGAELSRVTVTDPKTGHDWDDGTVTTAPTCTETGIKTYTCQNDPSHTYTETIPALGHDWDDGTITLAPTCTEPGVKTFTCKNDSSHTYTETIPALGHQLTHNPKVEPTYTATGLKEHYHCSVCGKNFEDAAGTIEILDLVIPKLEGYFEADFLADTGTVLVEKDGVTCILGFNLNETPIIIDTKTQRGIPLNYSFSVASKLDEPVGNSGKLATGMKLTAKYSDNSTKLYYIVILGDVNGDAKISALDYVAIKNHIMEFNLINGAPYLLAADYNKDNKISALDYVSIKNIIMEGE